MGSDHVMLEGGHPVPGQWPSLTIAGPHSPAPAAASKLLDLTPLTIGGTTNDVPTGGLADASAVCHDQAFKLDQILAALSQQTALAIQNEAATSKWLDHLEAELGVGGGSGVDLRVPLMPRELVSWFLPLTHLTLLPLPPRVGRFVPSMLRRPAVREPPTF